MNPEELLFSVLADKHRLRLAGSRTIILTVALSALASVLFPVPRKEALDAA